MIVVTGRTFEHRDTLKAFNGRWNGDVKRWEFDHLSADRIATLRGLVGCMVTESDKPEPPSDDDDSDIDGGSLADFIASLIGGDNKPAKQPGDTTNVYGDDPRYLNQMKIKNPTAFFGFSSLFEFVNYVEALPPRGVGYGTDRALWHGTPNMKAAIELTRNGWEDGAKIASEVMELFSVEHALKRRRQLHVTGGHVSVGRMLTGNPVHMVRRPKSPGRKIMTLFVAVNNAASIDAEMMVIKAGIVGAIADTLETEGYSCEIVSVVSAGDNRCDFQFAVTVKHAGEKMNMSDLVFALGHPSFLRRLKFASVSSKDELRSCWQSQGMPYDSFDPNDMPGRSDFYIPILKRNYRGDTMEVAKAMLKDIEPKNLPIKLTGE